MATPQSMATPDQYFIESHYTLSTEGQSSDSLLTPTASIPPTPGSLAGRKRSRGDIFSNDEELQPDGSLPTPEEDTFAEEVMAMHSPFNLGMPSGSMDVDGVPRIEAHHTSRPSISSRKSQRIDTSDAGRDDLAHLVLPSDLREATAVPLIDEATRALGISWTRMDSSDSLKISQAAYSKFIQNHYSSLKEVSVWFENSALPAYLVTARNAYSSEEAFYLFSHDLLEARLVTTNPADLLPRLQLLPAIELAAPGGHLRAETDAATVSQNELNAVLDTTTPATLNVDQPAVPRGRSAEPAYRYRELLCTAHEMEMD